MHLLSVQTDRRRRHNVRSFTPLSAPCLLHRRQHPPSLPFACCWLPLNPKERPRPSPMRTMTTRRKQLLHEVIAIVVSVEMLAVANSSWPEACCLSSPLPFHH